MQQTRATLMTSPHDRYIQWKDAERAYRHEWDRHFIPGADATLIAAEVIAKIAALRDESERLYLEWYSTRHT